MNSSAQASGTSRRSGRVLRLDFRAAALALRQWTGRQWFFAGVLTLGVGVLIGVATVLIPNSIFVRDIPPVWWNYPVWLLTSALSGMLAATYVRSRVGASEEVTAGEGDDGRRSSRFGMIGTVLAWFAVGCPVCNKIALLAFGYSGALTFFAPFQPVLAIAAMVLTGLALIWRLQGQVACPAPAGVKQNGSPDVRAEA